MKPNALMRGTFVSAFLMGECVAPLDYL